MATILIVEDEPLTADMLHMFLEISGHTPRIAPDGAAARAALHDAVPDVLLLDVMLPDVNGLDLLRDLRAAPATASLPVIVLSAAAPPLHDQARAAGANAYLAKPLDLNDLLALLASTIAQRPG